MFRASPPSSTTVSPDPLQQLVLREHAVALLDEGEQRLERLGRERHGFAVAEQASPIDLQAERPELVRGSRLTHGRRFPKKNEAPL